MERVVTRGLDRRPLEGLAYVGLDEKSFGKGHDSVSVLHDIAGKRALDVVPDGAWEGADTPWGTIPEPQRQRIAVCAMGRWENDMESTRKAAPKAAVVHEKFHCAKELNKAVDLVRRSEHWELRAQGQEMLIKTKYLWLNNRGHFTERQRSHVNSLWLDTLKVGCAWAVKEAFAAFWHYHYAGPARKFFDRWYFWATHSRLPPSSTLPRP